MTHHHATLAGGTMANSETLQPYLDSEYVKMICEQLGISPLAERCTTLIGEHVTWRLKVILGFGSSIDAISYRVVPGSAEAVGHELFVSEDSDLEVSSVASIASAKPPRGVGLIAHWLVTEGEQPAVPENPKSSAKELETELSVEENNATTSGLSTRDQKEEGVGAAASFRLALRKAHKSERVYVKPSLNHKLSLEQQLFFKEIMEACVGLDDKKRVDALQSLQIDTGLNALLPSMSKWLAQGVRHNVIHRSLAMLIYLVRAYTSLVHNKSLNLSAVLHEMVPSLLSCMMSRYLCGRPEVDNHWTLRDYASKCLLQMVRERSVCDTRARVRSVLQRVFTDANSSFGMQYGAFFALYDLSTSFERAALHGHFVALLRRVHPSTASQHPPAVAIEAERLYALLNKYDAAMSKSAALYQRNNNVTKPVDERPVC